MTHPVCWVELSTGDLAAAREFYRQAFGWESTDFAEGYALHSFGEDEPIGGIGFRQLAPEQRGAPPTTASIKVNDVAAMLAKAEELGATVVVPRTELGQGMGCFGFFRDPQGTIMGVWGPK